MTSDRPGRIIASGLGFCEGPVLDENGTLYVSSITHGAVYRIDEDASVHVVAQLGGGANAVTRTGDGRLVVAQNGGRWAAEGPTWGPTSIGGLQIIQPNGQFEWLSHDPIAPNDLCIGPDGLVYSTDPTRTTRFNDGRLWRTDPGTGETELLTSVPYFSNGIAFGPKGELYVASTKPAAMYVYHLEDDGGLSDGRKLFDLPRGGPDGFIADADGNLIIGAISFDERPGTIQTWNTDGRLLETFTPGPHRHYTNMVQRPDGTLLVCDSDQGNILAFNDWPARPLPTYPLR